MMGRNGFAAALLTALALGCSTPERSEPAARRCVADNGTVEWEFDIPGGLSGCDGIEFDFLAEGLEEFDTFEVRFRSGKGGYLGFFEPGEPGRWNHVTVRKSGCYKSASSVAGWNAVTRFALSGQRDRETKRAVRVSNVRALRAQPEILVVRPDSATKGGNRNRHVREACVMTSFLSDLGIAVSQTSDADLAEGIPQEVALLVFPDNPSVPTNALPALERYVGRGGKFLVMCEADGRIARLAGFSCKPFYDRRKEPRKPRLAGLVRTAAGLEAQPLFVPFRTNCLMEPRLSKDVIAVANWADADGRDLGLTGVARTPNGFCYSSDWRIRGASARALMRALLLDVRPAWRERLEAGERRMAERESTGLAFESLPRPADEVRALTCHNPKGLPGRNWDESVRLLKDGGFNTLIVMWPGAVSCSRKRRRSVSRPVGSTESAAISGRSAGDAIGMIRLRSPDGRPSARTVWTEGIGCVRRIRPTARPNSRPSNGWRLWGRTGSCWITSATTTARSAIATSANGRRRARRPFSHPGVRR